MWKWALAIIATILVWFYMYFYSPTFRHMYNLFFDKNEVYKTYNLYKSLRQAKDLNGEYKFTINIPELYAIGFERKLQNHSNKRSGWSSGIPVKINIKIIDKNKKIIYNQIIHRTKIVGWSESIGLDYVLDHIKLRPGKYTLEVKLLDGSFLDLENSEGVLFFYMRPTGFI